MMVPLVSFLAALRILSEGMVLFLDESSLAKPFKSYKQTVKVMRNHLKD